MEIEINGMSLLSIVGIQIVLLVIIISLLILSIKVFKLFPFKNFKNYYLHLIGGFIVVFLMFYILFKPAINYYTMHGEEFELKDYQSLTIKEVNKLIEEDGLTYLIIDSVFTDSVPKGTVFTQDPIPGTYVKKGRVVYLTINRSTLQKFKVPDVFNKSEREAVNQLNRHFRVDLVKSETYSSVTSVVTQLKVGNTDILPGQELVEGTIISVYFGSGRGISTIVVPNLVGLSTYNAYEILEVNNLKIGEIIAEGIINDTLTAIVFSQRPLFETRLQAGDMVDIVIKQFIDTTQIMTDMQDSE